MKMTISLLSAVLFTTYAANASLSYEYSCEMDVQQEESSTYFVTVDASGSRIAGLRVEGEQNENYNLSDVAQFKFQTSAASTELLVWRQPQGVGAYGLKIDVTGASTMSGVYQVIRYNESLQMEVTYSAPMTCTQL